jgi:hypothetical protein
MTLPRLFGLVGAVLFAVSARAADPKAPDLSDLREALTTADKRGENVGAIREALTAFEKAMAKGAIKPGAEAAPAPAELTALRQAVELAARKGEDVAAISKALGQIEKAVTGREYERPKPEVKPEPEPALPQPQPFRPRPGFGGPGGDFGRRPGGVVISGVGAGFNSTSVTISGGNFTIKATQGDVTYEITGQTNGTEAPKILIRDGEKKIETDDLKKVPEAYRASAEKLLKSVTRP